MRGKKDNSRSEKVRKIRVHVFLRQRSSSLSQARVLIATLNNHIM